MSERGIREAAMGWTKTLGRVALGITLGLALAEGAFWVRDEGAFPHVNTFVPDDALGARLEPGSSQRFKLGENPASRIRINGQGWRGEGWGAPVPGSVVVIGDSQVFGLGVDDDQTTPARLAAITGKTVYNAGVPTYGPEEYLAVLGEALAQQKPAAAVIVLNFANDIFELNRPNTERHRVWDGWAVRAETAPESVAEFPGRRWIFGRSHAIYALRRWLHAGPDGATDAGLPSEGDWQDVVAATLQSRLPAGSGAASAGDLAERIGGASAQRQEINQEVQRLARVFVELPEDEELKLRAVEQRARPGDIVSIDYGEASRSVEVTAEMLREGARLQRQLKPRMEAWMRENPDDPRVKELLQQRSALDQELAALSTQVAAEVAATSPFQGFLERAQALAREHGAALAVVALPIDVQVDPAEWAKYGQPPQDMTGTLVLLDDMVAAAKRLGIRSFSAVEPLRAAQPGAFLDGDIHLTPRGHAALAQALADALAAPAPYRQPGGGLAAGRSRVPAPGEWALVEENIVKGSTANRCETRRVREWQRITCAGGAGGGQPLGAARVEGPTEAMIYAEPGRVDAIFPLLPGRAAALDFRWEGRAQRLTVRWEGETPILAFEAIESPPVPQSGPSRLAACYAAAETEPAHRLGDDTRGCAATFSECGDLVACANGSRGRAPACPEGQAVAGSAGHCHALCDAERPCATGVCTDWSGAGVCL